MKHLPLGILITLFALLGHCTPLHAQNSDTTITCPWVENFEDTAALDLWSELTSVGNGQFRLCRLSDSSAWHYVSNDEGNHYLSTSTSGAYLVSPAILMPEDMVEFYLTWNATNNRFTVKVALDSSYSSVENLQWQQIAGSYGAHGIPMSNYQGQRIRLAISSAVSGNVNTIDDISLAYYSEVPVITHFNAPNRVGKEELIDFEYNLGECSRRDLVATWHSSLKDSTWNTNVSPNGSFHYYFYYDAVGVDTLTFVVSNEFGADTHQVVISVIGDPICNGPYAVPFSENFDSISGTERIVSTFYSYLTYTLNRHLPACWDFSWDGEAYKRPMVYSGSCNNFPMHHSSSALVMMAAKKQISEDLRVGGWDSVAYVMLPEFTAPLDTLSLIFFYRYEYNIGTLSVGYMDDDVFVPIADMQYSNYGRVDTVSFHGVPATASRMALRWSCNNAGVFWSVLIDDVRVVETNPLWMRPDVRLSGPFSARIYDTVVFTPQLRRGDTTALTYTWHSSLLDSTWTSGLVSSQSLVYSFADIDTLTLTASNSFGSNSTSVVVRVLDCDRVETPFYEDFEEITAQDWDQDGELPSCWRSTWNGSNHAPHVIPRNGYQYIDGLTDQALLMMAGKNSGYDTVVIVTLPRFDQPLQDLSIAFDYRFERAVKGSLTVGYFDRNDTFVSIADMTPHADSYRRETVLLNSVPDSNARLALRWWCNGSYFGVAIDKINIFNSSICNYHPVPYTENFDDVSTGQIPDCWTSCWAGYDSNKPRVHNYEDSYGDVRKNLRMYADRDSSDKGMSMVVLPGFDRPLEQLSLAFDYRKSGSGDTLSVGYIVDTVYTPLHNLPRTNSLYRRDTIHFSGVTVPEARMAIRYLSRTVGPNIIDIDNLRVVETDTTWLRLDVQLSGPISANIYDTVVFTPQIRRGNNAARTYTWHSSLLDSTWTSEPVSSLSLVYSSVGIDTLTLTASNFYGSATAMAMVRVIDCDRVDIPFYEDFEEIDARALPFCWRSIWNGYNSYCAPHVIPTNGYGAFGTLPSRALLILSGKASGYDTVGQVALPRFSQPLQELAISFDYRFENVSRGILTVGYVDSNDTFVAIANMTPHANSYRRDTVFLNSIPYINANLVLRWCNNGSHYGEWGVSIDNVEVFAAHPDLQGIEETGSSRWNVEVFPNPASTDVTVRVSRPSTLMLLDLQGRTVIPSTAVNTQFPIRKSQLAPGTYFLRVTTDNSTLTKKLVIL